MFGKPTVSFSGPKHAGGDRATNKQCEGELEVRSGNRLGHALALPCRQSHSGFVGPSIRRSTGTNSRNGPGNSGEASSGRFRHAYKGPVAQPHSSSFSPKHASADRPTNKHLQKDLTSDCISALACLCFALQARPQWDSDPALHLNTGPPTSISERT